MKLGTSNHAGEWLPPVLPGLALPLHQVLNHWFRPWLNSSHTPCNCKQASAQMVLKIPIFTNTEKKGSEQGKPLIQLIQKNTTAKSSIYSRDAGWFFNSVSVDIGVKASLAHLCCLVVPQKVTAEHNHKDHDSHKGRKRHSQYTKHGIKA